ncbi:hypothetical protein [Curtobacterium sp. MCSS17_015]|uniref:hypothetical protein n=1 Tax=Curtobacterium sp. MCSS17_015 TaxID=2175666 RepID=UPI0011B6F45A|nr:hypothetical protein [Curtobacterium sp. MCSS17_015]WIB25844.1 hypothetical protein DEJ18_12410 [Curtobacterium sp. MCSS17_015]
MSSVEPGDWMVSKTNPAAFLEVLDVWTEAGEEQVKVRIGKQERHCSKRSPARHVGASRRKRLIPQAM